jgi:hypothetical protein
MKREGRISKGQSTKPLEEEEVKRIQEVDEQEVQ